MEFKRKNLLLNELILVDGVGRSGKVMLAEIITGFNRVEKQDYHEFLEYIPLAYKYGKISKDIAISILQTQMDTELYKNMIGRSVNTRPTDYTSLYKYHTPQKYLKREVLEDGSIIGQKVLDEKPIYLNWCHDLIQKSDIIFEAFEDKVKLLYINRRPIDIIFEWDKKNFGERIANDTTEMQYMMQYENEFVPELAIGWEDEYLTMNPLERIVKMIYISFQRNLEAMNRIKIDNQVMIINFEDLVTKTEMLVDKIEIFIKTDKLPVLNNILLKENCPRILDDKEFNTRKDNIENRISDEYKHYLIELEEMYNKISIFAK